MRGTWGGGGTQYGNTVRKIGKYRNTLSKMDEIPIPHPSCENACPGGHSLISPRRLCAAEQGMVFKVLNLKQGIQFHY